MPRLTWNGSGVRSYEVGVDRGVLYVENAPGVPWVGLTSVSEAPTGGDARPFYLDGVKYLNVPASEEFKATLNAYTYPDEFSQCDGTSSVRHGLYAMHQKRRPFGLSYRTKLGNDLSGLDHGYKIHIIYNALVAPSQRTYNTLADSGTPLDFSWSITTLAPPTTGYKRTAHIVIDSTIANAATLSAVEDILYGSSATSPRIPSLDELIAVFEANATLIVTDNGDGTFTVIAPDEIMQMLDPDTFQITWPSAVIIDADSYTLSSL